jgi:WD40 repeat protein/tetratricopeptide (TPR) repeat protein
MNIQGNKMNPFPGLRPFHEDEDYLFFGREEQTMELLQRLGSNRFVAVVGTSGSGKSSLVRCGLLSELLGGKMLQAGAAWEIAVTHPGGNPLAILTEALLEADLYDREEEHARENLLATLSRSHFGLVEAVKQAGLSEATNFLLVVDQFEEIFRFHEAGQVQREVANEFISILLEAAAQTEVPIYVVLTMRSDFIGECGQFEGLAEMVNRGEFLIPRLSREQYKRVIEGPIKVAGGKIAPRLLQRLLNDLGQQADQLPCLQHALMRTWSIWSESEDTAALDLDDYQRVGKMTQALSLHADEIFESLETDRQRELCRGIFQALTVQESDQRGIRRPQRLGKLSSILEVSTEELLPIIDAYRQSGVTFLMPSEEVELTDQTIIDISHESLMRVWTRLRHWVQEEAQAAGIYRRLSESAALHAQGKAGLFRDPELGIALAWRDAQHPNQVWGERYHSDFERAMRFLEESQRASVAEEQALEAARQRELEQAQQLADIQRERLEQQQRTSRKLRKLMVGVAGVAVIAAIACVFALAARSRANYLAGVAQEQADIADQKTKDAEKSQQETEDALAQVSIEKNNAVLSLDKAEKAEERSRSFRYATDMQLAGRLIDDENSNARQILDYMSEHDPAQNEELAEKADPRGFEWHYLRRMIDSRATVFRGFDKPVIDSVLTPEGELITLDADSRLERHDAETRLETHAPLDLKQEREVASQALSPDGRLVAISIDNQVQLIDTLTGEEAARPIPMAAKFGLIFSPDGKMVVTIDQKIGWWEAATGRPIALEDSNLLSGGPVSISADGLTLAVGGQTVSNTTSSGFSVFRMNPDARGITLLLDKKYASMGSMRTLAISPDGKFLIASQLFSGMLVLFDSETGTYKSLNRSEHAASISAIGFNPAGSEIVTASLDGTIKVWEDFQDLTSPKTRGLMGHADEINRILFAPGGTKLVSSSHDKTTRLWDLEQKNSTLQQAVEGSTGYRARFSPDGLLIAASESGNRRITLWDATTGTAVGTLTRPDNDMMPNCIAFSPDNRLLAMGFGGTNNVSFIELWDIDRNELLTTLPGTTGIPGFSTTATTGLITALAFSPDGKHLVAGYGSLNSLYSGNRGNHPLLVYDVTSRRLVRRLEGHQNYCISVIFSQDGSRMASASYDGTARIWDTATWKTMQVLNNPDPSSDQGGRRVLDVAFSPDTELLATASHEGNVHIWNVQSGELTRTLQGHTNGVWSVAFSPDGKTLASGSQDQTIRLWNRATWRELLQLENNTSTGARSLAFSPTGDRILSAGGGTFLWSTVSDDIGQTGQLVQQLQKLLDSEADFQHRIRMFSKNLQLHVALDVLLRESPEDVRLQAASAATRANWHASREEWKEAAEAFDQLKAVSPQNPEDWLLTPGLMRVATAFLHQQRTVEAAAFLSGGEPRRLEDGGGAKVVLFGYQFETGQFPLKVNKVFRGSAAWKAGMRVGDLILKFNDIELTAETQADMAKASGGGVGTTITLTIQSPGQDETKTVELTKVSFINDDLFHDLIETLVATVDHQLTETPHEAGLLELKAEIAGQWSGFEAQVADYTAAIEILSELPEAEAAADLARLYRRRGDAYVGLKNWELAKQDYDRIVTDETTDEKLSANQTLASAHTLLEKAHAPKYSIQLGEQNQSEGIDLIEDVADGITKPTRVNEQDCRSIEMNSDEVGYAYFRIDDNLNWTPGMAAQVELEYWGGSTTSFSLQYQRQEELYANVMPSVQTKESNQWNTARFVLKGARFANSQNGGADFRIHVNQSPLLIRRVTLQRSLLEVIPEDPRAYLAAVYRLQDDQQAISQLVEKKPQAAGLIGDLFIQDEEKDWQRAIEIYSQGITSETTDVELLSKRARAYEALQDWQRAAADWSRAADSNQNGPELLIEFAKRLITADRPRLAYAQFERIQPLLEADLESDPENIVVQEQLAQLLLDKIDYENTVHWNVLKPVDLKMESGTPLTLQEDGSLKLEQGSDRITLPEGNQPTTAIRLEPITTSNSTPDDGAPSTEYQIVATSLAGSQAGELRGRFVRIDLPGDSREFPRIDPKVFPRLAPKKFVTLAEVQVYQGDQNIAIGKQAMQSSTHVDRVAQRAIDGNTDPIKDAESVAHTLPDDPDPFWELDLGDEQTFDRIVVWNRNEPSHWTDGMNYFRVRVLDVERRVLFEQFIEEAPNPSREIRSPIRITRHPSEAADGNADSTLDVSVDRTLFTSHRYRISISEDDRTVVSDEADSEGMQWSVPKPVAMKSESGADLVWQEDGSILRKQTTGDTIQIQAPSRPLQALRIETDSPAEGAPPFSEYQIVAANLAASQKERMRGRFVRIDLPGDNKQFPRASKDGDKKYINFAELQVFQGEQNLALQKSVRQSGVSKGAYAPENAVDGNTIGRDNGHPYFHSWDTNDPWWEVDLGSEQVIDRMVVWNRSDVDLFPRMNHFRIRLLDQSRKVVFEQVIDKAPAPSTEIIPWAAHVEKNAAVVGADATFSLRLPPNTTQSRFRLSVGDKVIGLRQEQDVALVQQISEVPTRLAVAYALENNTTESVKWFDGALNDSETDKTRAAIIGHLQHYDQPLAAFLKLHPDDLQLQLAQARNLVERGQSDLSENYPTEALAKLQQARTQLEALLAKHPEPDWTVLKPLEMTSEGGATLTLQEDNSILASGENPARDTYTVTANAGSQRVTAFRLEALPDPSLPKNGPGRFDGNGNFHLNEFRVTSEEAPVPLTDIAVSFEEVDQMQHVIDGKVDGMKGWGTDTKAGQTSIAVMATDSKNRPLDRLKFELFFSRTSAEQHNLGRFRLSVTGDAGAIQATQLHSDLTPVELANLDVALGKVYALQQKTEEAATAFARALDRVKEDADRKQIVAQINNELETLTLLAAQRPKDTQLQLALAKSYAARGNQSLAQNRQEEALPELDKARAIFARLLADSPEPVWTVLEPAEMTSEAGADLTLQPDGSIFVSGENAARDTYILSAPIGESHITGIRLEMIPDDRLPGRGSGRQNPVGKFFLSEIEAFVEDANGSSTHALAIKDGFCESSFESQPVSHAFDSNLSTYWGIWPDHSAPHTAVFTLEPAPSELGDNRNLILHLESGCDQWKYHNLGRFRFSVTNDPQALQSTEIRREIQASGLSELNLSLGKAYARRGQIEAAATAFARAIDLAADHDASAKILDEASRHEGVIDELSKQRSADAAIQDALAHHFQTQGDVPNALTALSQSRALYEQQLQTGPSNSKLAKKLADLLLEVHPEEWTVLKPVEMRSAEGATFTPQNDGSILVSGPNVSGDEYTITVNSDIELVQSIRLDVLPDESLPQNGPGRHSTGNFQLSAFRVYGPAADGDPKPAPIAINHATASFAYSANNVDVAGTIDEKLNKVWHVWGQVAKRNHAEYELASPLRVEASDQLKIVLKHQEYAEGINLGRFRLSVSSHSGSSETQQPLLAAAKYSSPWSRLGAAYDALGESDKALDMFVRSIELASNDQAKAVAAQEAAASEEIFAQLLERYPGDNSLLLGQAKYLAPKYIADQNFQEAVDLTSDFLELFPQDLELLNLRATAHRRLKQWQAVIVDLSQIIEIESDENQRRKAERSLAEVQLRLGQIEEPTEIYTRLMLLYPDWGYARDAYFAQLLAQNPAVARAAASQLYRSAEKLHANVYSSEWMVLTHITLPGLVTQQNQARLLTAAQEANEDRAPLLTAAIHYRIGDLEKAQPLLAVSSGKPEFRSLAAMLLYDQGEQSQARAILAEVENWLQQQRDRDPGSLIPDQQFWPSWVTRVAIWREAKRKLAGPRLAELDQQLASSPDNVSRLLERAGLLSETGLNDEALEDLNHALKLNAELNDAVGLRGRILAGLKKSDEAMIDLNKAIEQGSTDHLVYVARGRLLLAQGQTEEARDDLNHSLELQPTENAAQDLADLILSGAKHKISWTVLKPTEMKSVGGATLALQEDGSILVGGENPSQDQIDLVLDTDQTTVSAFRIEALTDESLPNNGPGRGKSGNFTTGWRFSYRNKSDTEGDRSISIREAVADFSYSKAPISKNSWNIQGGVGSSHEAYLVPDAPLQSDSGFQIKFSLICRNRPPYDDQNIGRFRLSVSGDPQAFDHERGRLAANEITNPWARLIAAYRLSGNEAAVAKLLEQRPELQLDMADYYASVQDWETALALYNKFITDETTDALLLASRAEAYSGAGQWDLAEADWKRAFELSPEDTVLPQRRLAALVAGERWEDIARDFSRQLDQLPEERHSYRSRFRLIRTIIRRDDPVFDALRELRPDDTLLPVSLARNFILQNDWKNAVKHYAIVEQDPPSEEWYEYAAALLIAGELENYRTFLTEKLNQIGEVEDPFMAYYLARTVSLTPETVIDRELAAKWGEMGIANETSGWLTHAAGMAHFRVGDYKKALERLQQSADSNWEPELNQLAFALVYAKQGEMAKARANLQLAKQWFADKETQKTDGYYSVQVTDWLEANLLLREVEKLITIE